MDREMRKDIENMIDKAVNDLEGRIELKIDLIIQMLKNNDLDKNALQVEQISHREKLNKIDIREAQRPTTCPYKNRVEGLEKKLDKLVYKTSIYTGIALGVVYFLIPVLIDFLKNIIM